MLAIDKINHPGTLPENIGFQAHPLFGREISLSQHLGGWPALAIAILMNGAVLALVAALPADRIFGEQGLLEILQVVTLLAIAGMFAFAMGLRAAPLWPLLAALFMMTLAFAMREGDLRAWDIPDWAKALGSGSVRNPLTAGFVILALILHIPTMARQNLWSYASSPYAAPVALCLLLLLCGKLAENLPLGWPTTELVEEMFEFNAYVFLAAGAASLYRRAREVSEVSV